MPHMRRPSAPPARCRSRNQKYCKKRAGRAGPRKVVGSPLDGPRTTQCPRCDRGQRRRCLRLAHCTARVRSPPGVNKRDHGARPSAPTRRAAARTFPRRRAGARRAPSGGGARAAPPTRASLTPPALAPRRVPAERAQARAEKKAKKEAGTPVGKKKAMIQGEESRPEWVRLDKFLVLARRVFEWDLGRVPLWCAAPLGRRASPPPRVPPTRRAPPDRHHCVRPPPFT